MIHLGLSIPDKKARIDAYCRENGIEHVIMLSPKKFEFAVDVPKFQSVDWPEIIMYRTFNPLMTEKLDPGTLLVVNECLRDRNRNCLTYNCIRHYLTKTPRVLVFQWLPCLDTMDDFMTLFDFDTGSKWKRTPYDTSMFSEVDVEIVERTPYFAGLQVETDAKTKAKYEAEREKLFQTLGQKDPHTIPRNLYLVGSKAKASRAPPGPLLARNERLKVPCIEIYKKEAYGGGPYTVLELPHGFLDFSDVMTLTQQTKFDVMLADLKVDDWYFRRFNAWSKRIENGYADLRQFAGRARRSAKAA